MPFYSEISTDSRARVSLTPGSYGSGSIPGLKIAAYIDKASKPDKSGAMRHSFLVSALKPSRESEAAFKATTPQGSTSPVNGHNPLDTPDFEGTAFFSLTLHDQWLNPESIALAFSEVSRNKEGIIQVDYIQKAITGGDATEESIANARAFYTNLAGEKVLAANTPDDQKDAAIITQYGKELQQVAIKVGTFFRMQDWFYKEPMSGRRDLHFDVKTLVGTEFSGKVTKGTMPSKDGSDTAEVDAIYSRK